MKADINTPRKMSETHKPAPDFLKELKLPKKVTC